MPPFFKGILLAILLAVVWNVAFAKPVVDYHVARVQCRNMADEFQRIAVARDKGQPFGEMVVRLVLFAKERRQSVVTVAHLIDAVVYVYGVKDSPDDIQRNVFATCLRAHGFKEA